MDTSSSESFKSADYGSGEFNRPNGEESAHDAKPIGAAPPTKKKEEEEEDKKEEAVASDASPQHLPQHPIRKHRSHLLPRAEVSAGVFQPLHPCIWSDTTRETLTLSTFAAVAGTRRKWCKGGKSRTTRNVFNQIRPERNSASTADGCLEGRKVPSKSTRRVMS